MEEPWVENEGKNVDMKITVFRDEGGGGRVLW
jgi:hypothetical protein